MKTQALIFDLDGTMWDATDVLTLSWNEILASIPGAQVKLTKADVCAFMGRTMDEIIPLILPHASRELRETAKKRCARGEVDYLYDHGATLYDGLEDTLRTLSARYALFAVSNCQLGYIGAFLHAHRLERYFRDYEEWERTGKTKAENIRLVMERNRITSAFYIGDTAGDQTAAKMAGIGFIHAAYGFGMVEHAPYSIAAFCDLPALMERIDGC